jgi:hypothetical protein
MAGSTAFCTKSTPVGKRRCASGNVPGLGGFALLLVAMGLAMISPALGDGPVRILSEDVMLPNTQKAKGGGVLPLKDGVQVELEKPFPIREGAFSAWVRPINWDGQTVDMIHLFRAEDERSWWRLFKYRIDANNYGLTFVYGQPSEGGDRRYTFITAPIRDWRKNAWHHVAVTWDENEIRLFIDGERVAASGIKENRLPQGAPGKFRIASPNVRSEGDIFRTAFDRVEVYDRPLTDEMVVELSRQGAGSEIPPLASVPFSVATIPRIATPPKIDGVLGPGEWDAAARFLGGLAVGEPFIRVGKTFVVHAAYDEKKLYVMLVSPVPSMQLRADTLENGNVSVGRDDAVEILLAPGGDPADYFQIIGNSQGYYFSTHAGDKNWKGQWEFANTLYEGFWYAEFAVPFSALGLKTAPAVGTRWKANFCRDWATEAASIFTSWSFTSGSFFSHMGEMVFGGEDSGFALEVDDRDLAEGTVNAVLRTFFSSPQKVRIQTEDGSGVLNTSQKEVSSGAELRFSEALPAGRVTNVQVEAGSAQAPFRQPIPLRVESSVKLTILPDLEKHQIRVTADLGKNSEGKTAVIFKITDGSGKLLREAEISPAGDGSGATVLDAADLPEGRYRVSLERNGEMLVERDYDHMGDAGWRNWKRSFQGVPKPWTPIGYEENALRFWGREYTLDGSLLPAAMSSLGQPVTRGPLSLEMVTNGQAVTWDEVEWLSKDSDRGRYRFAAKNEDWKIEATVEFEFDGYYWVDLDAQPLRPEARLDKLILSIPFAPGVAEQLYAHNHSRSYMQGRLTAGSPGGFFPSIWIGNDEIGLAWFTESDRYWNVAKRGDVARFHPDGAGGRLEIRLVDTPVSSKEKLHYGFGIQATPVRPLDPQRRTRRLAPTVKANLAHPWSLDREVKRYGLSDKETPGFLSPHFTSVEAVKAELGKWRAKGLEMPWYIAPDILSPQSTEFQVFRDEWKNPHGVYPYACVNSTFSLFTQREMETLVRDAGLRAIYVDCAKAYPCGNSAHGCGYRDANGKLHLTYPVRALREYFKNLYITLHENGGDDASLILHLSAGLSAPIHGFSDMVLEGEEVQYLIGKTPSYFDLMPPDKWRTIFGKAFGINVALLPNYGRVGPKEHRLSEALNATFLTQALLNDTPLWNLWTNEAYVNRVYSRLDDFGWAAPDVRFEPYWKQDAVSVQGADLKVSIYHTAKGALLAIGNFGKEPLSGKLSLNLEKLGLGPGEVSVTNLLSGASLSGERPDIRVPSENFLLLAVKPKNRTTQN